jgi:pimeloyl-ACP methyl ester carboxylesterase
MAALRFASEPTRVVCYDAVMSGAAAQVLRRVRGHELSLAYREWNAAAPGPPLVLLHGITGSSSDWGALATRLDGHRLLALDARGHGASDWAPDAAYAGDQHFADLATALEDLELDRSVLVGFSMGGGIAIIGAAAMPDRVAALVVVDTYPDPTMSAGSRRIAQWIAGLGGGSGWFDPAISDRFREDLAAGGANRLDLWPMWEAIECPTLVVRGALSDVLPATTARQMVDRQPRAELLELPGVAHGIPHVRPAELAEAIRGFVRRHLRGVAGATCGDARPSPAPATR